MKRYLFPFILLLLCLSGESQTLQTQIQAKRGVFMERLYLKDRWIDGISTDLNTPDSTNDNMIATAKAVADYIKSKLGIGVSKLNDSTYLIGTDTIVINGYTAGNGLTKVNNSFKLGGALTERTTLIGSDTSGYINITGQTAYNTPGVVTVTNNYSGNHGGSAAINGIHNFGGIGVRGLTTSGTAVWASASTYGVGIECNSTNGISLRTGTYGDTTAQPLVIEHRYSNAGAYNRVYDGIKIIRSQASFPGSGNGIGSRISFQAVPYDNAGNPQAPYLETKAAMEWKTLDVHGGDRTDELNFQVRGDSILNKILLLNGRGYPTWPMFVGSTFETVDTSYASLVIDNNGRMYKRHGGNSGGGGGGASGADPSATIGLNQVNGIATTYMRSDAAPALNQAITPVWTNPHTFNSVSTGTLPSVGIKSASPQLDLWNTSVTSSDQRRWNFTVQGTSNFQLRALAEDGSTASGNASIALNIFRNGNQTQDVQIWAMGSMRAKFDAASGVTLPGLAGAGTRTVAASSTGVLSAGPSLASGSWSPTLTADVNVGALPSILHATYSQVGNIVTCFVTVSVSPTAATTQTEVGISLPVTSNFTSSNNVSGCGAGSAGNGQATFVQVTADATNDRAVLIFQSSTNTPSIITATFQYILL